MNILRRSAADENDRPHVFKHRSRFLFLSLLSAAASVTWGQDTLAIAFQAAESPAEDIIVGPHFTFVVQFKTSPEWFDLRTFLRANPAGGQLEVRPTSSASGDSIGNRTVPGRAIGFQIGSGDARKTNSRIESGAR